MQKAWGGDMSDQADHIHRLPPPAEDWKGGDMSRLRTFHRKDWKLWADRVPVMHESATLFTLWRYDDGQWKRLIGGVQIQALRKFIGSIKEAAI
jgi:hypothetical protein